MWNRSFEELEEKEDKLCNTNLHPNSQLKFSKYVRMWLKFQNFPINERSGDFNGSKTKPFVEDQKQSININPFVGSLKHFENYHFKYISSV